ncbi:MFS transporter [Xanthobacter dioxanivorans]|nr:MFS transporter [Xanthobacter dioxanivorans]
MPFLPILGLAAFASAFSLRVVDPMLNILAADLQVSLQQVALLASAFTLPYAAMQLFFGPIGDAVGKVRLIRFNLSMLAVGLALSAVATGDGMLLVVRAFSGAFAGGIIPVVLAAVGDRVPFEKRAEALSRVLLALVLGQLGGSALAGVIAEYAGWRPVFWCAFAVALAAALAAIFGLTEERTAQPLSFRASLGRYALVLGNPLSKKIYAIVALEGALIFGAFPLTAPLLVSHGLGDAKEAGLALGTFAVGGAFYTFAVSALVRRLGLHGMVRAGAAAGGFLLMAIATGPSLFLLVPLFGLAGFAFYMIHNVMQILATELAPEARGSGMALFASSFFLGQGLGAIVQAQVAGLIGPATTFLMAGIGMVLVSIPAGMLPPRTGKVQPPPPL